MSLYDCSAEDLDVRAQNTPMLQQKRYVLLYFSSWSRLLLCSPLNINESIVIV